MSDSSLCQSAAGGIGGEKRKLDQTDEQSNRKKIREDAKARTKAWKAKRPGFSDEKYNETTYYFENGLRKVYPYYFTFTTFCKGRWVSRSILEVFSKEFRAHPEEEYERCIKAGTLTVNYTTVPTDYLLQHNDLLANIVHRHEVPVANLPIRILHESDDLVVVDKPASIPVHPCGRYRHNTIVFILAKEFNLKNLRTIHRLDRLTSGLLLFGRTVERARQLEHEIRSRLVSKEYVCRVEGEFPSEVIVCEEPIEVVSYKIGVCRVGANGKECKTDFERLSYNGSESVVLCKPRTGRMHQIRVHLQFLGYPIVNDPLYNHPVFGPQKGKDGNIGKSNEELIAELITIHNAENWLGLDGDTDDCLLPNILSTEMDQDGNKNDPKHLQASPEHVPPEDNQQENNQQISQIPDCSNIKAGDDQSKDVELESMPNASDGNGTKIEVKPTTAATEPEPEPATNELSSTGNDFDPSKITKDSHCYECKVKFRDPKPKDLIMYLHAWKYKGPEWAFETTLPEWASDDWVET